MKDLDKYAIFALDKVPENYYYEQIYYFLVGELTAVFGYTPYGYGRYVHELISEGEIPRRHEQENCPVCRQFGDYNQTLGKDDKWWFMEHLKKEIFLFKHPKCTNILQSTKENTISWYAFLTGDELELFTVRYENKIVKDEGTEV